MTAIHTVEHRTEPAPAAADGGSVALRHVTKVYRLAEHSYVTAVRDLSLEVTPGEFLVITGRSGSGKTTLLNLAAGLTRPSTGEAWLDGVNLWALPDKQQSLLRNQKIGFIFQFPSLFGSLTALENVVLPTMFSPRQAKQGAYERAAELLDQVGLADKASAYPRQLSAGQQKRVVIARSLVNRPHILLADEPTSDLDEQTEAEFMDLLREIHTKTRTTVLMVTHNRGLGSHATRALEMANGAFVA